MAAKRHSLWLVALALIAAQAHAVDVTVAYQTSAEPAKVAQADDAFAKRQRGESGMA
ncbi:Sulfate starvation-induced protein 1 [Cedecea neteri]|uniref:Sulfate starvation-induced protein 1 n=1 Tax=Cedecea neteri TaxID=158822 RepID=A0A2X2VCR9_9ENTR|nr:Sulfate starvation-induced protein 1 [Cedecea neteri]